VTSKSGPNTLVEAGCVSQALVKALDEEIESEKGSHVYDKHVLNERKREEEIEC
jgi:hypothetical protein